MEAQHCKLLHCAKRKVQENKRQKPGVDLAARIFCPQGNQREEKGEKKENCDSFHCWQWQYPRSEGNTDWKEGSKGIRAISSHRTTSFSFFLLALSASPTACIVPALRDWVLRLQVDWKPNLHSAVNQSFNLGNQTYMPGLWLYWPGIKQNFSSSLRGSSARQGFRPDDWKPISAQVPSGVYATQVWAVGDNTNLNMPQPGIKLTDSLPKNPIFLL